MANTENAKLKLLLIYDYFLNHASSDNNDDGVSMQEILSFLNEKTGTDFERKSIYSDIDRVNDFARKVGMVGPTEDWIELVGKRYMRGDINGEITLDEARLIVDAINTTEFTDSGLCDKIKTKYPTYFRNGYTPLVSHNNKAIQKPLALVNVIRSCIEDQSAMSFKYGYVVAGGIRAAEDKLVSPVALDFEKSHYYLIAVDNNEVAKGKSKEDSMKRYRLDRMKYYKFELNEKYLSLGKNRDQIVEKYVKNSFEAYSSNNTERIVLTMRCPSEKELLKAFTGFTENMKPMIISDKTHDGYIRFSVDTGIVPPFFSKVFQVNLYKDVTLKIEDEAVREKYREYLVAAMNNLDD
ncbi:MAG: WYL domain-containing protein [Saccharofermentans sp.]|nr:WYL domain-containing protein [Saccharofermentans sp.]